MEASTARSEFLRRLNAARNEAEDRGIRREVFTARSELVRRLIAAVNEAEDRGFSQVVVDFRD